MGIMSLIEVLLHTPVKVGTLAEELRITRGTDMPKIINQKSDLNFLPQSLEPMPIARRILMVRPTHFHVDNPINPHMLKCDGTHHVVDKSRAMSQWENLKQTYLKLGLEVHTIEGGKGLPDMCFCANQSLPVLDRLGNKHALLSNMANDIRHQEVPLVDAFLQTQGYATTPIANRTSQTLFEGMGDCLWLPGRRFLLGGYGSRTSQSIYSQVSAAANAHVAVFELTNPRCYHLDTCLALLTENAAIACRDAFSNQGWELLKAIFPQLIEVSLPESDSPLFACNAHCPDQKHVILQEGSKATEAALTKNGFVPVPVATDEFIKSGGSVFCMKLSFF